MEYELYVIFDAATNSYGVPMAQTNDAEAMRSFAHEALKPDSIWNTHPQDFFLFKVGIYDCLRGCIDSYNAPERICCATDFVRKEVK